MLRLKLGVLLLEFLTLPPCTAVLEPDGDLAGVKAELGRQLIFPFGLQLVLAPETELQHVDLLVCELPLPHQRISGAALITFVLLAPPPRLRVRRCSVQTLTKLKISMIKAN